MAKQTSKQTTEPQPKVNGAVGDSGFIPPKGQRKYYWVELTKYLTVRGQEKQEVNVTHQCFTTKQDFELFSKPNKEGLTNAERIGWKNWKLVWNPEVYM